MATQDKNLLVLNAGQIEKAAATDTIRIHSLAVDAGVAITGDTSIDGDLSVTGTIVSKNVDSLVVRDPFIDLGLGNTTATPQAGGFSVSMNRLSSFTAETVTDFVAGVPSTSAPTFTVSGGSSALAAGDIVAIVNASDVNNDGLYVVASVAAGVVTIKGVGGSSPSGSVPFVQNQFTAGTSQNATAYKVEVVAAAFADGTTSFKDGGGVAWAKGLFVTTAQPWSTEAEFNANGAYDTAAQTSLQEAYVTGNTITTSAGEGDVVIAGDQKLDVTATGGVSITNTLDLNGAMDADVTTYDVNASGAYNVLAGAASSIATSAGDLTLDAQAASLILDGGEAAADAVRIVASAAGGGIDIDAGTAGIAADSTGAISLGAAAASDFTVAGNLTLETTGAGITEVKSAAEVQVTTLLLDVNATGAVEIDAAAASNFTVAGAGLTLSTTTSGNIVVSAAAALDMDAVGAATLDAAGISLDSAGVASNFTVASTGDAQDLTLAVTGATNSSVLVASSGTGADAIGLTASAGGITVDAAGALSLDSTGTASNLTLSANDAGTATLTIAATNTGAGAADLDIDADGAVTIDGASFSIDATSASNMTVTGGNLTLSTATSGVLAVTSAGNLDMDAVGTVTIDSSGAAISIGSNADAYGINIGTGAAARTITVGNTTGATALDVNLGTGGMTVDTQSGGAISLDAVGAASNFTVDGGDLTLSTLTSGNLVLASAGNIDADGAIVTVDATAGISLDAATASNFTVTGSGQNLSIGVAGGGAQQLILGSAGTGADAVRLVASAGGIDADAAGAISLVSTALASDFTLNANSGSNSTLTIESKNAGAGQAILSLKAENTIVIGDNSTYPSAFISVNHFAAFAGAAGYDAEAGEALVVGNAVVAKWDAGAGKVRYFKAANDAVGDVSRNVHGIVGSSAGAAGSMFRLQSVAGLRVTTALTGLADSDTAKPVFLGTAGALTLTPPTASGSSVFRVGFIVSHNGGPASTAVVQYQPQFIAKIL